MAWSVSFDPRAIAELRKLDRSAQQRIVSYLQQRAIASENPRNRGKAMVGGPVKLWRYRIGDYRVICKIDDGKETILVLRVGQRREIYR